MSGEISIDARALYGGLRFAMAVGEKAVLCMAGANRLRLAVAYDGCGALCWEQPVPLDAAPQAFVLPVHVMRMLTGGMLGRMDVLRFAVGAHEARLQVAGGDTPIELTWQWNLATLGMPAELEQMLQPPQAPVTVPVGALTAAVNQAVAQAKSASETGDARSSLVPVKLGARTVNIGGRDVTPAHSFVAYFDSACIARAVAIAASHINADCIDVEVRDFDDQMAFFALGGNRGEWTVRCTVKSVMVERDAEAESPAPVVIPRASLAPAPADPYSTRMLTPRAEPPPAPPPDTPPPMPAHAEVDAPDADLADAAPPAIKDEAAPRADPPAAPLPQTRPHTPLPTVAAFKGIAVPDTGMLPPDYLADVKNDESQTEDGAREDDNPQRSARDAVTLD